MRIDEHIFKGLIDAILKNQERGNQKIMAAIDDLKTSIANLGNSITKELTAIATALSNVPNNDPAIQDAVTQINSLATTVDNETATLSGGPVPTPTPAPTA